MSKKTVNSVIFSRQDTYVGPENDDAAAAAKHGTEDTMRDPGTSAPGGDGNGVYDPRSPPVPNIVPRTPAPGRKEIGTADTTAPIEADDDGEDHDSVPPSPLQSIVYQSQPDGTPSTPVRGKSDFDRDSHTSSTGEEAKAGGGLCALCCCFSSQSKAMEASQQLTTMQSSDSSRPTPIQTQTPPRQQAIQYVDPMHPLDKPILPPLAAEHQGKLCLVLDLDETLVHSSFRAVPNADYIIPVVIEDIRHHVYVCKRPGVEAFLKRAAELFEVVVYTASLSKYADPLLDKLDESNCIKHRLFRESCTQYQGNYVKNLSLLGRDLNRTIIVDNSPFSYLFHPDNAVDCTSWFEDPRDRELKLILDFCEKIQNVHDVTRHMRHWRQGANYKLPA